MKNAENNPKISVIVPIYKVENYLYQCISSILNQTFHDIEVILVDEGEDDTCYAIMCYFASKDERVKIIHEKNGGYGASVNKALKIVRGEYISIIESDDFIEEHMYEDMYRRAHQTNADIVKTPFYYFYDGDKNNGDHYVECTFSKRFDAVLPPEGFTILEYPQFMGVHPSLWSAIYKTSFFRDFNIKFNEVKGGAYIDHNFRVESYLPARKIVWLGKPYYRYRMTNPGASSAAGNINVDAVLKRWSEVHQFIEENYPGTLQYFGHELVAEMYHTAYSWTRAFFSNKEQVELLEKIILYYDSEMIKKCNVLNSQQRNELLVIHQESKKGVLYEQFTKNDDLNKKTRSLPRRLLRYLHFDFILQHNKLNLHLFKGCANRYFFWRCIFFEIFSIDITVGK